MQSDIILQTKAMAKRRVEDILNDESFENKKCDEIKIKLGINFEKVPR